MRLVAALILTLMVASALAEPPAQYLQPLAAKFNDRAHANPPGIAPSPDWFSGLRSKHGVGYEAGAGIDGSDYLPVSTSGSDESPPSIYRHWGDPHENLNGKQ